MMVAMRDNPWAEIRKSIRERWLRSASRGSSQPPAPISTRCAVVAFTLVLILAPAFAFLLIKTIQRFPGYHDFVFFGTLGVCQFCGAGTLVAAFYDHTWWRQENRAWISGFNILTWALMLPLSGAIKVLWFRGS